MKSLLEQIESRLAVCAKATPGPWGENSGCASDTGLELFVTCDEHHETVAKVYTMGDREFIAASRNQREGELAALKVALEKLNELDQTLRVPAAEYVPAIADAFTIIDQAITQITELMGEGK